MKKLYSIVLLSFFACNLHAAETPCVKPPSTSCPGNFFVEEELLFWKARQGGLDLLASTAKTRRDTTVDTDISEVEVNSTRRAFHSPHFDCRWGVRLGAGYDFANCEWAVAAYWTHLSGLGAGNGQTGRADAKMHWDLSYDVLDAIVTGPQFCLGSTFAWRAFGGVRAAKIDQHVDATSENVTTQENPFSDQNITRSTTVFKEKSRSNFQGIGPEVGVKGGWKLGKGWSMDAHVDGALLYSYYTLKLSDHVEDTSTRLSLVDPTETDQFIAKDNSHATAHTCQAVVDFGLGVCWRRHACLCAHKINWVLRLGWEHSQWFDHGALGRLGDLCLDGLTLSAQVQF